MLNKVNYMSVMHNNPPERELEPAAMFRSGFRLRSGLNFQKYKMSCHRIDTDGSIHGWICFVNIFKYNLLPFSLKGHGHTSHTTSAPGQFGTINGHDIFFHR